MTSSIQSIALDKLVPHPDNPNKMSEANFKKLVRNIERTSRYEPVIVRKVKGQKEKGKSEDCFQIINGEHRCKALSKLGYECVDAIVWDVDDQQTDVLLATLNRLCGSDELAKKLMLLKRLNKRIESTELAKILPQTAKQIALLTNLKRLSAPAKINAKSFANPMVFFVTDTQQQIIENALSLVEEPKIKMTKAARRAAGLAQIAGHFLNHSKFNSRT